MREAIEIGYQAFVSDGGEEFGAVRAVSPNGRPELVIYVDLELRQAGSSPSAGDRSRARRRRAQRLTFVLAIYPVGLRRQKRCRL